MHPPDFRPTIYVSSKRTHTQLWKSYRNRGQNIISSWIDLEGEIDIETIGRVYWPIWLSEAASTDYLIFYATHQDINHAANMMEIAVCLHSGGTVLHVGVSETMKTASGELAEFLFHPKWHRLTNLDEAFKIANCGVSEQKFPGFFLDPLQVDPKSDC